MHPRKINNNILTYLRIKDCDQKPIFSHNKIQIGTKTYQTDSILYGSNQGEVFSLISKSILTKCMQGYNCSIFAYGQTGSGKTYTIEGTESNPGLVQKSLSFLHNNYDQLKLSFIEIYNENMIDLYNPENQINIRDDPSEGVVVDNLTVFESGSLMESLDFYKKGTSNRKTASTSMNPNSSRSHSIFTIQLETKSKNMIKRSKLRFVDLAGSEKINDHEVERIKEACNINKSLLCLGKIVHKLSSNDKWHISYRDSKLTFLLKDSLGGNSVLAIIGTISMDYPTDTINTLNFLNRSKLISNHPSINYDVSNSNMEEIVENMKELDIENQRLKEELLLLKSDDTRCCKSVISYYVKNVSNEINIVRDNVDRLKNWYKELVDNYFYMKKHIIYDINEKLGVSSESQLNEIKDMQIKKPKTENK